MKFDWVSVDAGLPPVGAKVLIGIPVSNRLNIESAKYKGNGVFVGCWARSRGAGQDYGVLYWCYYEGPELNL